MRDALAALPGVRHITVDFDKQQAIVSIAQNAYNEEKLVAALKDAGFGGSIKGTRQIAPVRGDGAQPEVPPHGNGLNPPKPGDLSATDSEPISYSSASFRKHVQVGVHLDHDALRPGDAFRLAVVFDIEKGWHIYGNPVGPGVGRETVLSAEAPDGFDFDSARYAPAHRLEQDFGEAGKTWVWEHTGKTIHYLSGAVRSDVKPGDYQWTVEVFAQVCTKAACLPGTVRIRLPVTVAPRESPSQATNAELFVGFEKAKMPRADNSDL